MLRLSGRRTPWLLPAAFALAACGSQIAPEQAAPGAGPPSPSSSQVPGTSPRPSSTSTPPVPSSAPTGTPSPRHTASEGIVTESTHPDFAVVDQRDGDFVTASGAPRSLVEIGLHGVGLVSFVGDVRLQHTPAGTTIHYEGRADLDTEAEVGVADRAYGAVPSGASQPTPLRLDAVMTPDGLGHADVWIAGVHHRVQATEPPETADAVVAIVLADYRARDWGDLYDHTVSLPGYTRRHFVRIFSRGGTVTELTLTGRTRYEIRAGVGYADTPAHIVATLDGRHLDRSIAVELTWVHGEWRFSSLARSVHGNRAD